MTQPRRTIARDILILAAPLFCILLLSARAEGQEKTLTNSLGMEFVLIEPGSFMMGSPEEEIHRNVSEKRHEVEIENAFYFQTTEVTLKQWWAVMGKKWLFPRKGPKDSPVTKVSWHDCQSFINRMNSRTGETYRLPSEAEWEYACRAGTEKAYSWGDEIDCSRAMYANNESKYDQCVSYVRSQDLEVNSPAPVGSYAPNPWGLYDMHGNVWEWCRDCFGSYTSMTERGTFECSRRVRRGGSWFSHGSALRCANRAYAHPSSKFKTTGFRLVKEVP
ncbi:MAG: formylglycine-generating enzyme family protein [Desulfohalobiaceae bacterium]|nr:formylglycine-generating enzyme family protein [Desulfohalobiaceae bacterium]